MKQITQNKYNLKLIDLIIGIVFTLFFVAASLIIVINSRFLYYNTIDSFQLEEQSGLKKDTIIKNYDVLIDYCSPFNKEQLQFPDLPSSESGLSHFAETKIIFKFFYSLATVTGILLLSIILYKNKQHDTSYLKTSAYTVIILPLLILIIASINFNKLFILFHKIAFNNDDWLFDPYTDPIINLLPEEFFRYCAIEMILLVITGAFLLLFFYKRLSKKHDKYEHLKYN